MAVPGPFKRIARAGGQKVTIRIAQRAFFKNGSGLLKSFFAGSVTTAMVSGRWENRQFDAVAPELALKGGAELLCKPRNDPFKLQFVGLFGLVWN